MGKRKWFGFITITLIVFESKNCLGFDCNSPETEDNEYDPEYIAQCRHLRPPGVQETIDLLDKGEEQIVINDAYKNVVFMLGNTGSGKSTAVQWLIIGDEDELIAKETGEGDYIIEDKHARVGNSTITSQTIFPELTVDSETNTGFYDFSGFRDTRSTSHDIATSYFIKKIVDHVASIKVVAAVSYPSVRVGGDRQDFRTLLRHLTEELTNIKKFRHSIALLVTKVDNNEKIVDQDYIPIDDQTEIESIATFLREVKSDFLRRLRTSEIKSTDYIFYKKAGILIDILLQTNGDQYRNIGIFRRPEDEGSLSSNKLLQEGRNYFRKIVLNKLEFVAVDTKDFGYTISEKSMNEVNDLKREVHKDILSEIYSIAKDVNDRYINVVEQAENNLKSVHNSTIDADLLKLQVALDIIDRGHNLLSKLVLEESNYDPLHLCTVINSTLTSLKISAKNLSNLYKQSNYLKFLEEVSGKKVENFQTWVIPFNRIVFYLNKAKTSVETGIKHIEHLNDMNIRTNIKNEVQKLITLFYRKEDSYEDIQDIIDEANLAYKKLFIINDINDPQELINYLNSDNISNYQINLSQYIYSKLIEEHRHFAFFKNELNNAANYFHDSEKWYTFLKKLLFKLSTYEIQKDKNKCGKLLNDITDTDYDIKVAETGLKNFLTHCVGTNDIDAVKDLTINQIKYQALLKILDVTLEDHTTQECIHGGKLLIKGNFVTFSDINFNKCLTTLQSIEIFALHKVFIDSDLDKTGLSLVIVAPKWEIKGDRKITLDGAAGKAIVPERAKNGVSYGSNGADGQAGNPGGPGGSFLGHAEEIIDSWRLTVSANGGNGGAGQHGGDGAKGENGELPTVSQNELSHSVFSAANTYVIDKWSEKGFKVASEDYTCLVIHKCYTYYVSGKRCQDGGNGGLGGHGGLGGNPGLVNIISKGSAVRVSALPGNSGLPGHGGTGADAGEAGGDIIVREYHKLMVVEVKQWYVLESVSRTKCNAGRSPLEIIKEPQPPKQLNESSVFEEFKNFFTSNLGNVIHNEYNY